MQEDKKAIKILYTNWEGKTAIRSILPKEIVFKADEWHGEEQWCLEAYDLDKKADRTFACKDIKAWFLK